MPTELHAMTFNDYIQIVGDGRRWEHFEPFFGGNRVRTRAKLEQLRDIRNVIFHFRREITVEEHLNWSSETCAAASDAFSTDFNVNELANRIAARVCNEDLWQFGECNDDL